MNKAILAAFGYFLLGFFLFLFFAPLNQSSAVGLNGACSYGSRITSTPSNTCDSGLECNTDNDKTAECEIGKVCHGYCRKYCTVRFSDNGSNPNSCDPSKGEVCWWPPGTCQTTSCSGYCILDSTPHVDKYGTCTSLSSYGGASAAQGNCKDGLVCNTAGNPNCSSSSGGCTGTCFPTAYSCNVGSDSRTGVQQFDCPGDFTCAEAQGKQISQQCQTTGCSKGGCGTSCKAACPGCMFNCVANTDMAVKCTCDKRAGESSGSGNNGFTCRNNITSQHSFCDKAEQGCYDDNPNSSIRKNDVFQGQDLHGIQCIIPAQKDPPAPPCAQWNANHTNCIAVSSSLGDLFTDPGKFIGQIFGIVLATSGAIAVILIMRAGYQLMTARGNAEGLQKGREQIVAAIVGLMFLIFSFILLQVIGGSILRVPGF